MASHRSAPASRRWWHRLFGAGGPDRPYGLPEDWMVVDGPWARTATVAGPGGVFLLDHRRSRPDDVARLAGDLSGRLTTALGRCVSVHGVLVEEAERPVRANQPRNVTVVTSIVLGPWLESHPRAYDPREVRILARALHPSPATVRSG